ncbi:fructosamine kinase family protein [Fodinicurvata sp. EGI_FJ10296]|uniref:fructosamine kinase family protein n=1 Tax=Fodinicurvata sp. EGI_FJ10296 TaxID=3231908 RepID=UPI003451B86D
MTAAAASIAVRVDAALGAAPVRRRVLQGGSTVTVEEMVLQDGRHVVVKHGRGRLNDHLAVERSMLDDLAADGIVPVPDVLFGEDDLLIMAFIAGDRTVGSAGTEEHAADILAALHDRPQPAFGYTRDTVIGQLPQPNPRTDNWLAFYRDHRLLHMAEAGNRERTVPDRLRRRLETLAGRLDRYLTEPDHPSLLHGDVWTGNVIARDGRIAALIDPAIYWGHPEIELAFITMFNTFGQRFFDRYRERRGLDPAFFDIRRDLYLIYPLLVHVRYWDTSYARGIESTLDRLGL